MASDDFDAKDGQTASACFSMSRQDRLGYGAYANVFLAKLVTSERPLPDLVAVKQARCSATRIRTPLYYEARVLQFLQGGPGIPNVYGYERIPHFERFAMQLLTGIIKDDESIGEEQTRAYPPGIVAQIAIEMLETLEFLHSNKLVHRDVKPANIAQTLPPDSHRHFLIDYNIAVFRSQGFSELRSSHKHVMGTINYASLRAHKHFELMPRDDLESLAYTLFELLHGFLPWGDGLIQPIDGDLFATSVVFKMKTRETGQSLFGDLPNCFRDLLEVARSMKADEVFDYRRFIEHFKEAKKVLSSKDVLRHRDEPKKRTYIQWNLTPLSESQSHKHSFGSFCQWHPFDSELWDNRGRERNASLTTPAQDEGGPELTIPLISIVDCEPYLPEGDSDEDAEY